MTRKTILATAALGATLTLGAVGIGTAVIPNMAGAQSATSSTPAADSGSPLKGHPKLRAFARQEFRLAADTIGIPATDLRDAVKGGQSVAEVAEAHGVSADTVVNAVVGDIDAKVDRAVTNGKITQERADTIKERAPERVTKLVDAHRGDHAAAPAGN